MNLGEYITDYFKSELEIGQEAIKLLDSIKSLIYVFVMVNFITSFYAFYILFAHLPLAFILAVFFQFIFILIYIVLFATVRRAEYLKKNKIKKYNDEEIVLRGKTFKAQLYRVAEDGLIPAASVKKGFLFFKHSYGRILLLMILGFGPAFFFGLMVHHPFVKDQYAKAKQTFIDKQISNRKKMSALLYQKNYQELDAFINTRAKMVFMLDSLRNHPDPNGYYLEDVEWYSSRLKLFDALNYSKIINGIKKRQSDSVEMIDLLKLLDDKFQKSNFFILRAKVSWFNYPLTFILSIFAFLILLVSPFVIRYRMLIYTPEILDVILDEKYKSIIEHNYHSYIIALNNTECIQSMKNTLAMNDLSESRKKGILDTLFYYEDPGRDFYDPPYRVKPKPNTDKIIDKGNLSKYLGHL